MAKKTTNTGSDTEINGSDKVQASETQQETASLAVPEETKPDPYDPKLVKEAVKHKNNIKIEFGKIDRSVFKIAFEVHWLYDNQAYIPLGYDNIYDLARSEFDIARGTTSDYINMIDRFGERDDLDNFTGKIMEKYAAYSSSKLVAMHDLTDNEIDSLFRPDMSVREIKKYVCELIGKDVSEKLETGENKDPDNLKQDNLKQDQPDTEKKSENESISSSDPVTGSKATGDTGEKKSVVINGCYYRKLCEFTKNFFESDDWKDEILKTLEDSYNEAPYRWISIGYR